MDYEFVFNIGLNRSGTTSLTKALNILEIPTVHFSIDGSTWSKDRSAEIERLMMVNKSKGNKFLHGLDDKYRGFSDFNGEIYFKTLYKQYPNSKFIFTLRPVEDWIKSVVNMERHQRPQSYSTTTLEHTKLKEKVQHYFSTKNKISEFFKDKPGCLLQMDIPSGDGWEVLCPFLGKNIPTVPFPYLNQSEF